MKLILLPIALFILSVFPCSLFAQNLPLSKQEENWLAKHSVINVSNEDDWPPFDFSVHGQAKGYSIDLIKKLAEKIGIKVNFINGYTWSELLDEFDKKNIDLMHAMSKSKQRMEKYSFSGQYMPWKMSYFTRKNGKDIGLRNNFSGLKVAAGKDWATTEQFKKQYPEANVVEYENTLEMLNALSTSKVDICIDNNLAATYAMSENIITNIENAGYVPLDNSYDHGLHFVSHKSAPELASIFDKAYKALTINEKIKIQEKWFYQEDSTPSRKLFTKKELKWIKKHPVVKVSNELDYPPFDFAVEGIPQGYSIDLINILARYIGVDIEYVNGYTWNELVELFKNNEIDMLHSLTRTPKREMFGIFSNPFIRYKTFIFTNHNNTHIKNIKQLYGKTVVVGKGWAIEEYLKNNYPQINLLTVDNVEAMLLSVIQGKADALINDNLSTLYKMKMLSITSVDATAWFKELDNHTFQSYHFVGHKDAPELISILNKALTMVSVGDVKKLREKWFGESQDNINLTDKQKLYLAQKDKITMCIDPNWMPYEEIDSSGKHIGISADYVKLFSARINKEISLYSTKSWVESIGSIKNKRCDILPLAQSTNSRKEYLNFTKPYVTFPFVLATTNDKNFIDNFDSIKDEKLAVVKGFSLIENLHEYYKNIQLVEVDNAEDGLRKVKEGTVYAYIDASAVITRTLQQAGIVEVKINGNLPWNSDLAVATRKDEPQLHEIFQKLVTALSEKEKKQIYDKWIAVKYETYFDYTLLWKIAGAVFFILAITAYWNRRIRLEKNKVVEVLSKLEFAQNELKQKNVELELLASTDPLTQLYNRRYFYHIADNILALAKRNRSDSSIIMLDIDKFKAVNDIYGHGVGDDVIMSLASVLQTQRRKSDIVSRWGGEEFVVLLPDTNTDGALIIAEKIRKTVEQSTLQLASNKTLLFTVSIGVSQVLVHEDDSIELAIKRSDNALYKAKTSGRNRVCLENT